MVLKLQKSIKSGKTALARFRNLLTNISKHSLSSKLPNVIITQQQHVPLLTDMPKNCCKMSLKNWKECFRVFSPSAMN